MELLPLDFYSLTQAVEFINQKTNSAIKENSLYSYAIEEKIRLLLKIEIKDNQLIKIGRNDSEGFFISPDSELFFKESSLNQEDDNHLSLSDRFSSLEIDKKEPLKLDGDDLFLMLDKSKVSSFKGYIVLHPELLDLFCKDSLPQHGLTNTNYLSLESLTLQTMDDANIFSSFDFTQKYPIYNENEQLYLKHTFRINFSDIKIHYNDLKKLLPTNSSFNVDDLKREVKELKSKLEEKAKKIAELQTALEGKNYPIFLNQFMENDRLALAIQARKDYWGKYNPELNNPPKAEATAKELKEKYNLSDNQAKAIEIVACPINRNQLIL